MCGNYQQSEYRRKTCRKHPTQKPCLYFIDSSASTRVSETIFTHYKAVVRPALLQILLGRKFIGIDQNEEFLNLSESAGKSRILYVHKNAKKRLQGILKK